MGSGAGSARVPAGGVSFCGFGSRSPAQMPTPIVATASRVSARPLGFKGMSASYPPGRSWRTSYSISPNKVDIAASSNLGRKGRLPFYTWPSSPYHQCRPVLGLLGKLLVLRIAVANPDYSSNAVRLIDAGAVHRIVTENYYVAPTRTVSSKFRASVGR